MKSTMLMLVAALLVASTVCTAAKYEWTGSAGDLNWNTPANWDVKGSIYTWPHEQYGAGNSWVNDDCEEITIATGQTIERSDGLTMRGASATNNAGKLSIENNSGLHTSAGMVIGRNGNGIVKVEVSNQSLLSVGAALTVGVGEYVTGLLEAKNSNIVVAGELAVSNGGQAVGILEIKDNSSVQTYQLIVGGIGLGVSEVKDSTLDIENNLVVGRNFGATGRLEIEDSGVDITGALRIPGNGSSAYVSIKGSSTLVTTHKCSVNFGSQAAVGELVMDDGTVIVNTGTLVNENGLAGSLGDFTLNGGTWNSGGDIKVGTTLNGGNGYLTINGGTMDTNGWIWVGSATSGQSRVFVNGGVLQGENLVINMDSNSLIVFRGGELWINNSAVTETDMQDLITAGKIAVPPAYEITTIGGYTVLRLGI